MNAAQVWKEVLILRGFMKRRNCRKLISLMLVMALLFSVLPSNLALAEEETEKAASEAVLEDSSEESREYDSNGFYEDGEVSYYEPASQDDDGVYLIENAGNLYWFAALVNGDTTQEGITGAVVDANALVQADIDLNPGYTFEDDGTITGTGTLREWNPIGDYSGYSEGVLVQSGSVYTGAFDGGGYTISGMYIYATSDTQGLFGYVYGGSIRNVYVTGSITVTDKSEGVPYAYIGGIAGTAENTTISHCGFDGSIVGGTMVGGIVGDLYGNAEISYCYNNADIVANNGGGIAGYVYGDELVTISYCYNTGLIKALNSAAMLGGLVGNLQNAVIQDCYNSGEMIIYGQTYAGGVTGCALSSTIENCYYLKSMADDIFGAESDYNTVTNVVSCTADEFASGAAAWLFNGGEIAEDGTVTKEPATDGTQIWYQNLDNGSAVDSSPVLDSSHGTVYMYTDCQGGIRYSNSDKADGSHIYGDDGFCTLCGAYQPASQDDSGVYEICNAGQLRWFAALVNGTTEITVTDSDGNENIVTLEGITEAVSDADARLMDDIDLNPAYTFSEDGSYTYDASLETRLQYVTDEEYITVHFQNTDSWSEVCAYYGPQTNGSWTSNTSGDWPGIEISEDSDNSGWYTVSVTADTYYIIFNDNNNGSQTCDIELSSDADEYWISYEDYPQSGAATVSASTTEPDGWTASAAPEPEAWTPIGNFVFNLMYGEEIIYTPYNGTFYGEGYTISGVYIAEEITSDVAYELGLFGHVEDGGIVQNVTLANSLITVTCDSEYGSVSTGGIAGGSGYCTIINCSMIDSSISISGSAGDVRVGGIAGDAQNVSDCMVETSAIDVSMISVKYLDVSGIAGYAESITNCSNSGSITVNAASTRYDYVGGIVSYTSNDTVINNCYNTGAISVTETNTAYVGGIAACFAGSMANCYNRGELTCNSVAGGLVGYNNEGTVTNCYYLEGTADYGIGSDATDTAAAVVKTEAEFASGEVAWLLQSGQETDENGEEAATEDGTAENGTTEDGTTENETDGIVWGQDLSGLTSSTSDDSYPVLTNNEKLQVVKVDFILSADGASTGTVLGDAQYTNTNQNVSSYPTYESAYSIGSAYYLDEACTSAAVIDIENATYAGDTTVYVKESMLVKLYSRTLTLDGSIGVNYYVDLSSVGEEDRSNYTVVFTVDGVESEAEYDPESWRDDFDSTGTKYYRFTGYVTSVQMASEITVQLVYHYESGETQVVGTDTYSVMDYCEKSISNGWSSKDLCEALLNYGGYAQTYFAEDEGTDDSSSDTSGGSSTEGSTEDGSEGSTGETLANAYLSTWDSSWKDPVTEWSDIPSDLASHSSSIDGTLPAEITSSSTSGDGSSGESTVYFSATLLMQSQTVIRLYFNLADEADKDVVTFAVDGTELEIYNTTAGNTCYGDYDYYVEFKVPASRLSTPYEITVSNTSGQEATVTYSALTYVNNKLGTNGTDDENLHNLCIALYYYSKAADAYEDWYTAGNE